VPVYDEFRSEPSQGFDEVVPSSVVDPGCLGDGDGPPGDVPRPRTPTHFLTAAVVLAQSKAYEGVAPCVGYVQSDGYTRHVAGRVKDGTDMEFFIVSRLAALDGYGSLEWLERCRFLLAWSCVMHGLYGDPDNCSADLTGFDKEVEKFVSCSSVEAKLLASADNAGVKIDNYWGAMARLCSKFERCWVWVFHIRGSMRGIKEPTMGSTLWQGVTADSGFPVEDSSDVEGSDCADGTCSHRLGEGCLREFTTYGDLKI